MEVPGRIYVLATLLPLAAFVLLLAGGTMRAFYRPFRKGGGLLGTMYWVCGGDKPLKTGAYLATAVMAATAALAVVGLVQFLTDPTEGSIRASRWAERIDWVRIGPGDTAAPPEWERQRATDTGRPAPRLALALELGYKIDHLTAVAFAMVSVIATLIFVFSTAYMADETAEVVSDHLVRQGDTETRGHGDESHGHGPVSPGPRVPVSGFARRGRYGRFFLYLSLFCFSMLNLLVADNLFQVFVSWELVGVCSFFLIGFYYERPSASAAANKAFIVNRVGDAGFLVGIVVAWSYCGTLNIEELTRRLRSPERDTHAPLAFANQVVRVNQALEPSGDGTTTYELPNDKNPGPGTHVALFPLAWEEPTHFHGLGYARTNDHEFSAPPAATYTDYGVIPYALFVLMGLGIFLGCVGKSAQVPLHTWLPDAMEGPTPVSALIHAATMVAAGVYLVGRCYPLFAPEVLLVIAYVGAVTLFVSATVALVQTDIKRILAYSTCSQLGFMMLALGIGAWTAGLLHLITHAFFKALLFLCSGSVIHGCHHEQDVRKMGGLWRTMPVTAFAMLVGVFAISGAPFLSGWYSKDQILAAALGYGLEHKAHVVLLALPFVTALMTAYYMFRLWFLTFAGTPRGDGAAHAHESPLAMTAPLVVLAVFSVGVAWGWPFWEPEASALGHVLEKAQPAFVAAQFAAEHREAEHRHLTAGALALVLGVSGAWLAWWLFGWRQPAGVEMHKPGGAAYRFLRERWYFDELYDAAIVNPTVGLAKVTAAADKAPTDRPRLFPLPTLDGLFNAVGEACVAAGQALRAVQTGRVRTYVLALALTAAAMLGILTALAK